MTLEATPPFAALFEREDPFRWAATVQGDVFRETDGRRTLRVELDGRTWFLKTHRRPRVLEHLAEWLSLRRLPRGARQEVTALRALEGIGLRVPRVVAWGERGADSFVVTADVGTQETVGTLLAREGPDGVTAPQRAALVAAVADIIGRMHRAGVNHRDCYLVHVPLFGLDGGAAQVGLMDLHRAQVRSTVPHRWRAKDLGGLWFSARAARLTPDERALFRRTYLAAAGIADDAALWRSAERRALALEREEARRGARFGR